MTTVRRAYVYLLAYAGLAALGLGVANLLRALLDVLLSSPEAVRNASFLREQVSLWGAAALVGLPIWLVHWIWARRLAATEPAERASTLRRLYLYAVLAGATFAAAIGAGDSLGQLLQPLQGAGAAGAQSFFPPLPLLLVGGVVGMYHWRVASRDRQAVGETGSSATLRRWYVYGTALVGFARLLAACAQLLQGAWLTLLDRAGGVLQVVDATPSALVGLGLWLLGWGVLPAMLGVTDRERDQRSTLRSVYLFLALALSVTGAVIGLSQVLYYALARALGVADPGGEATPLLEAAAGPVGLVVCYGAGWLYQRRAIQQQALVEETNRQVGVRRLYTYLVALVGLTVLAIGLAGLLWIVGDALTHGDGTANTDWWRDRVSLFGMLALVGLLVWLLHWRPIRPQDAGALSRRLYLYLALIGGVLGVLVGGVWAINRLLAWSLGDADRAGSDLAHALAVLLVAVAVIAYHWSMLRRDQAVTGQPESVVAEPAEVVVRLRAANAGSLTAALRALAERGVSVEQLPADG